MQEKLSSRWSNQAGKIAFKTGQFAQIYVPPTKAYTDFCNNSTL